VQVNRKKILKKTSKKMNWDMANNFEHHFKRTDDNHFNNTFNLDKDWIKNFLTESSDSIVHRMSADNVFN